MNEDFLNVIQRWAIAAFIALGLLFLATALGGCQERYRYPCQDPKNWETEPCQRPLCAATQSCPDQLAKPEEMKGDIR